LGIFVACIFSVVSLSHAQGGPQIQTQSGTIPVTHEGLQGALWMQSSAEYRVLCKVTFNQAKLALEAAIKDKEWTACLEQTKDYSELPPAVVLDIDETVLDNSRFQGEIAKEDAGFDPALWAQWVNLKECEGIPGALDFIKYAQSKGVTVFFITNRDRSVEEASRDNLTRLGVQFPESVDTVLTQKEKEAWSSSDKSSRRAAVAASYRILLLLGDDLGDFVSAANYSPSKRIEVAELNLDKWGTKWFLIANPVYGSWDGALYNYDYSLKRPEILKLKWNLLKGFK
jgi:acid phosphatase